MDTTDEIVISKRDFTPAQQVAWDMLPPEPGTAEYDLEPMTQEQEEAHFAMLADALGWKDHGQI